ncbi:hypothetical protein AKJ09_07577 [Labilithrix luteola]|uniref:Right handed beta helix domain-containing protein n=1 Tax=Labilithrix luteola TaxID=1391654 RepID=A0A0K1Q5B8_9BACT|nr:hypothetical protein AKJ09_07577 [Labilithrix luteola]
MGLSAFLVFIPSIAAAGTLTVGPGKMHAAPCAAIAAAAPGDVIEIDAAGTYQGDVCSWSTDGLTLRGVNGRPKIDAAGKNAAGKGVYVVAADHVTFENLEIYGAKVPDNNGAGIRHQGKDLVVRGVYFHDNENGILGSPAKDGEGSVLIEQSEFAQNGFGDGYSHNLYLGAYGSVTMQSSYSHGAKVGHLLKSRARINRILYNRLTDEAGSTASYELDFPNGGLTYVIGNLIEQSAETENPTVLAYGEEGTSNADQHLFFVHNTVVNDRANGGTIVNIANGVTEPALVANNVLLGQATVSTQASSKLQGNCVDTVANAKLVDAASFDYHLGAGSPCIDHGVDLANPDLLPTQQYEHPTHTVARAAVGPIDPGAYEFGNAPPDAGGGTSPPDGGGSTGGSPEAGPPDGQTDSATASSGDSDSGCGCRTVPNAGSRTRLGGMLLLAAVATLASVRARARRKL